MERVYVENDPQSAPHFVAAHQRPPSPTQSSPFTFVPDQNDKFVAHQAWAAPATPLPFVNDASATTPPKKKKWLWILIAAIVFVVVVVAAVVGGVVGSRNTQSKSADSDTASSPASAESTIASSTSSSSASTTASSTSSSATATTTVGTSANGGTTRMAGFKMFGGDTCNGTTDSFTVTSAGDKNCVRVPSDKRSIKVTQNDSCVVTTWSGNNCAGSSYRIPDDDCHSVLYAAVSVTC